MAAGLPSAGIGGLFYLLAAVALPLRSAWRRVRGVPDSLTGRELTLHLGIAAGIVAGIWAAGWLLTLVVPAGEAARGVSPASGAIPLVSPSVLRAATIAAGFLTLGAVLAGVEAARFTLQRRAVAAQGVPSPVSSDE
ncbi:MAG: hypothetical protein ACLGIK_14745, partial [Gemmatimonadota bacterium]